jgi:hypothetical protein
VLQAARRRDEMAFVGDVVKQILPVGRQETE